MQNLLTTYIPPFVLFIKTAILLSRLLSGLSYGDAERALHLPSLSLAPCSQRRTVHHHLLPCSTLGRSEWLSHMSVGLHNDPGGSKLLHTILDDSVLSRQYSSFLQDGSEEGGEFVALSCDIY